MINLHRGLVSNGFDCIFNFKFCPYLNLNLFESVLIIKIIAKLGAFAEPPLAHSCLDNKMSESLPDNDRKCCLLCQPRNLFVPVATTLKELSSLMGSRVGVKHWRDFAFFQATNRSDSLRLGTCTVYKHIPKYFVGMFGVWESSYSGNS